MTKFKKLVLLSAFLLFLSIIKVNACSCSRVGIIKNQKQSDVVFKGKVINVNELVTIETYPRSEEEFEYRRYEFLFEVKSLYKGRRKFNNTEKLTIITTGGGADCGSWFDLGETYLVYSSKTDRHLRFWDQEVEEFMSTNLCTRTKKFGFAALLESIVLRIT